MLKYTNEFEKRFRMSQSMFDDLVEELRIPLTVLFVQSMRSTFRNESIYPEVIVAIGLRILGPSDTPNNMELIHCEEEAQTVIVILVFCRHILTFLTSKTYSQQWMLTAAIATTWLQIYNHFQLGIQNTT